MNNHELIESLKKVLKSIEGSIKNHQYEHIKECLFHGEEGIALEDMCTYIDDYEIRISESLFKTIELAGIAMEMSNATWSFLEKNVIKNSKSS